MSLISKVARQNAGFSMVEMIVALGVLGVIMLGVTTFFANQFEMIRYIEDKLEQASLQRVVISELNDINTCTANLAGKSLAADPNAPPVKVGIVRDKNGGHLVASQSEKDRLQIGQIQLTNKSVPAADATGLVKLHIPVTRMSNVGKKAFKTIEIDLRVKVDKAFKITRCVRESFVSFDPLDLNRDGWLCSCNGDYSSSHEGGSTICLLQKDGEIADMWVAPYPWTMSTGADFDCNKGVAPTPSGGIRVLRWHFQTYTAASQTQHCNLDVSANTVTGPCP